MSTNTNLIADAAWPRPAASGALLRDVLLVLAGSALIAVCAHIKVPMYPVPMTMQPFAVLLVGLAFGWRLGGLTVLAYLAEGALGLPVFTGGAGLAYMAGPTGGYLVGFLAAAVTAGWLAGQGWGRPAVRVFLAMLIGTAVIYAFGLAWLAFGLGLGLEKAVTVGMLPFIPGDLVKAALAAALLPLAWRLIGR
ncbi:MAG: biotin transporter BioY [Rhizobiales bacterium]|nr:biotin transporter BioY [Hyphomicrobiales bacterium]